jgi:hypothetical protein
VSGFSADWLALREPHDAAARNRKVMHLVAEAMAGRFSITAVDLACGTGSTPRALAPHLPFRQAWRLVDNDLGLLARAAETSLPQGASIHTLPVDLARDLEAALDGAPDLVTSSALLDLVSAEWLERFVVESAVRALPVYAALIYDGRATLTPSDPYDAAVIDAVNQHQRTDKGFGPALGPAVASDAIGRFERTGIYRVTKGASDWVLEPGDAAMQRALLEGWAQAAEEMGALPRIELHAWLARRSAFISEGQSSMQVGHVDIFAQPISRR